jgi:hypothetical protein
LIVSAWVVGMPWGNPLYVFSVPFGRSCADSGPESAAVNPRERHPIQNVTGHAAHTGATG